MTFVVKDRVRETSTTTGTGSFTLSGAVQGFQSFSVIGDSNTTFYAIVNTQAGQWEVGIGTYTLATTSLSRDTVLDSSNSGALVNFSAGEKDVFVTYPAEKALYINDVGSAIINNLSLATNEITSTEASDNILITPTGIGALKVQNRITLEDRLSFGPTDPQGSYFANNAEYLQSGFLSAWQYIQNGTATKVEFDNGAAMAISNAPSGNAGDLVLGWTEVLNISSAGDVVTGNWTAGVIAAEYGGTGLSNVGATLDITGNASISGINTGDQTDITGNAGTATKLQTARTINGVAFDGTANITIATATPNNLTIASPLTGGSFNGSAPATIGLPTANSTVTGALSSTDWATFNTKQAALSGAGIVKSTNGTISYLTDNSSNWNTAYSRSLTSATVTGTTTKTLTLNQQGGTNITASWSDLNTDAVTSVFGRTGAVVATEGDYSLTQLSGVNLTSPTNGQLLQNNGTQWVNWTPNYLTANQVVTLSGDVTGSGSTAITATLANTTVTAGTYGNATQVPQIAIDSKGRATSATNVTITPAWASITSTPTTVAGYGITDGVTLTGTQTLTNKTVTDATFTIQDDADNTKKAQFQASGITTATTRTYTLPNVNGTLVTTGDTGSVTNTMLAGSIADTKLSTIATAGKVSNSATTATSANTASAIVARDASGNFTAGNITASLIGNANTATTLQTARNINGVSFNGSADITIKASTTNNLTISSPLSGGSFDGGSAISIGLSNSGVVAGTYGNSTQAGQFTVGDNGLISSAANVTITPAWASITSTPTTISGYGITDGVTLTGTQTLTNKTVTDATFTIQDDTDNTKKAQFQASGITTATTRTYTLPNVNGTLVTTGDTGTVTNTMLAGSIADTNLNTISTAGKVSNSATTATSANTASAIVARDASGNFNASKATLSDQLVLTRANNPGTGPNLGQLSLEGAAGNRIDFNTNGVAAPSNVTRSLGTKIVLYPAMGSGNVDYALGIDASTLWQSVPISTAGFKWYANTAQIASLSGTGVLTASSFVGSLAGNANTATSLTAGNADFYTNTLPANTGGTDTYMYVGRWTTTQTREKLSLKILYNNSSLGYTRRASEYMFFFNTSDGVDFTTGSTGNFYGWGRGFTLGEGGALDTANTRVVQVSNTQYDIYVSVLTGIASGIGGYVINISGGSWAHSGTNFGSTIPTGNTYILYLDNILTNYMSATFLSLAALESITAAKFWDAANNQASILMAGDIGSRIEFQDVGLAIPAVTTRSVGTKIVTRPTVAAAAVDFAIGATSSSQWYSVDTTSSFHTFYTGTTVSLRNGNSGTSSRGVVYEGNSAITTQNTGTTLTIAQILTLVIQSTPTANINFNLPTGTNVDAGVMASLETNRSFTWSIVNLATGFTVTVLGATGNTYVGNTVIAASSSASFRTIKTGTNTFVTYRI